MERIEQVGGSTERHDAATRGPFPLGAGLDAALHRDGVAGLLAALNARTRYRFTGLYRVDPPLLRNVCLFDRENPWLCAGGDINTLDETYCALVAGGAGPVAIADAPRDRRYLPQAPSVLAYLGVPVLGAGGEVWGTLCHYDVRPRVVPEGELPVLEWAAAELAPRVAVAS